MPVSELSSHFRWRRWQPKSVRFWKPGDPDPSAEIWFLIFGGSEIAKIEALGNGQWLASVFMWCAIERRKHGVADSEAQARAWCQRWAEKNAELLRDRFPLVLNHPNGTPRDPRTASAPRRESPSLEGPGGQARGAAQ